MYCSVIPIIERYRTVVCQTNKKTLYLSKDERVYKKIYSQHTLTKIVINTLIYSSLTAMTVADCYYLSLLSRLALIFCNRGLFLVDSC